MDVPADRSRPTSAPPLHPTLREAARSPTSAAAHRGGPAAALSAPDQWHRLAGAALVLWQQVTSLRTARTPTTTWR